MKIRYICPICQGDNVLRDAFARWDEETQWWTLHDVYDQIICDDCGVDIYPEEVPCESASD